MGNPNIGRRLRRAREAKRLTQKEVAEKIGIHNSTLGKYELGEREPDFDTIKKLAEVYEVSPVWLLIGSEEKFSHAEARPVELNKTIQLIEYEAERLGLSPTDPEFQKLLSNAFELLRIARGKDFE